MSKLSRRIHRVARPRRRHEQPRLARVRALDVRQPLPARRKLPTVVRGHVRRESGRKAQESFPALSRLIIYTERMIINKCVIYTRIELCNSSNIGTKRKNDISHPLRTGLFFVRVGSFLDVPKIRSLKTRGTASDIQTVVFFPCFSILSKRLHNNTTTVRRRNTPPFHHHRHHVCDDNPPPNAPFVLLFGWIEE